MQRQPTAESCAMGSSHTSQLPVHPPTARSVRGPSPNDSACSLTPLTSTNIDGSSAWRTTALGGCGTLAELSVVLDLVVPTARLGDQSVGTDHPFLAAGDAHGLAGLGTRAGECPVVLDEVVSHDELVHEDLDIGEGGDERLRNARYRGRVAAVDGDRPAHDVVGSN